MMLTFPPDEIRPDDSSSLEKDTEPLNSSEKSPSFLTPHRFVVIALSISVVLLGGILIGRTITLQQPPFLQVENLVQRVRGLEKQAKLNHTLPGTTFFSAPWRYFILLRQDLLSGLPFKKTAQRFVETLSPALKPRFQEILAPLSVHRVKSLGELSLLFHPGLLTGLEDKEKGFWGNVWGFLQRVLTVQKRVVGASLPPDSVSHHYGEFQELLEDGRLEELVTRLQDQQASLTGEGKNWLQDAQVLVKTQQILEYLEQELSGKPRL